jgi:hypothetical protein
MPSVAERLALAEQVQSQWYPQRTGAWLKAVSVAALLRREGRAPDGDEAPRAVLELFLECELYKWMPEDSAYGTFTDCAWRAVDRAGLLRCVDSIFADAARGIAEIRAEEAAEEAVAEAGGYRCLRTRSQLDGDMIDLEALRRWFTDELWGATPPTWFTNTGPDFTGEPAAIGVDGDVLALLWAP